jgi:hypothetical protein
LVRGNRSHTPITYLRSDSRLLPRRLQEPYLITEFNDVMGHFGPGDTVPLVVQRGRTQVRLSVQLAAEP